MVNLPPTGTAVAQRLRCCATNRKVAGSTTVCAEQRFGLDVLRVRVVFLQVRVTFLLTISCKRLTALRVPYVTANFQTFFVLIMYVIAYTAVFAKRYDLSML